MTPTPCPSLPTKALQEVLDGAQLPTMPAATLRIMELAACPTSTADAVGAAVITEPTLAARVLGLANSTFYNRGAPFTDINRAVAHLGLRQVRSMALALHLFSVKPHSRAPSFDLGRFWRYCLTCAVAAKLIARQQGDVDPEEAFAAALLQDLGVLALHRAQPEEYEDLFRKKALRGVRLHLMELDAWGYDHSDVGAAIAAQWGLPPSMGNAIRLHHRPRDNRLAELCHLGDLVHATIYETRGGGSIFLAEELRAQAGESVSVLTDMQVQLPQIADACSCPSWTPASEQELKQRIQTLLDDADG